MVSYNIYCTKCKPFLVQDMYPEREMNVDICPAFLDDGSEDTYRTIQ